MDALATLVAVIALLASLANGGYHVALGAAAARRPGGAEISRWVRGRTARSAGAAVVALLALLVAGGGATLDVVTVVLAAGATAVATRTLQSTRRRFPTSR